MASAHGRFDERARAFSAQLWATTNRWRLLGALTALGVAGLLAITVVRRTRSVAHHTRRRIRSSPAPTRQRAS